MNQEQKAVLVFAAPSQETPERQYAMKSGDQHKQIEIGLDRFIDYFKGFKIESIELSLSAAVESGPVMKFIVSGKAEAAVTVILKPE